MPSPAMLRGYKKFFISPIPSGQFLIPSLLNEFLSVLRNTYTNLMYIFHDKNTPCYTAAYMKRFFAILICAMILTPLAGTRAATLNAGDLIKASGQAVYYYTSDGKRFVFPNEKTYFTWYSSFSNIKTISDSELAAITIGGNVTYRPGKYLVKITTDPKVYAVDTNGALRWVTTEALAKTLYGLDWAKKVQDIPDAFFVDYGEGSAITSASHYDVAAVLASQPTISSEIVPSVPTSTSMDPVIDRGIVKTSTVNVNDLFRITIDSNPSTGYSWKPTFDSTYLSFVTSTYVAPTSTAYGVSGTEKFDFRALKETDHTDIVLDYIRPFETNVAPAERRTFRMTISPKPVDTSDISLSLSKTQAQANESVTITASTTIQNPKAIRLVINNAPLQDCTTGANCSATFTIPATGAAASYAISASVVGQDGSSATTTKTVTVVTQQTSDNISLTISKPMIRPGETVDITVDPQGVVNAREITIFVDSYSVKRCQNNPTTCKFSNTISGSIGSTHTVYATLTSNAGLSYQTVTKSVQIAANDAPAVVVTAGKPSLYKTETVDISVTASDNDGIGSMKIMQGNTLIKSCNGPTACTATVGPFPTFSSGDSLRYTGFATDLLGQSASSSADAIITIL